MNFIYTTTMVLKFLYKVKISASPVESILAQAGKKEGGLGEGIFARPRFSPPPNFVPVKLARRNLSKQRNKPTPNFLEEI